MDVDEIPTYLELWMTLVLHERSQEGIQEGLPSSHQGLKMHRPYQGGSRYMSPSSCAIFPRWMDRPQCFVEVRGSNPISVQHWGSSFDQASDGTRTPLPEFLNDRRPFPSILVVGGSTPLSVGAHLRQLPPRRSTYTLYTSLLVRRTTIGT